MGSSQYAVRSGNVYCQTCGLLYPKKLDAGSLQDLFAFGQVEIFCDKCAKITVWNGKVVDRRGADDDDSPAGGERREEGARRTQMRVHVSLPIRVRCDSPDLKFVEVKKTLEASRQGCSFVTNQPVQKGMALYVVFPYSEDDALLETSAKVTRVSPAEGGAEVGFEFIRET
jgi:hypothetical protein